VLIDWGNKHGVYREQKRRYELPNSSMIHFCHAQYEKDVMIYHGAEIHLLLIDELTTFTEFQYTYLRNRVRTTLEVPLQYKHKIPGIICASNPGGVGHEYAKRIFVDFCRINSQQAEIDETDGLPIYEHHSKREEGQVQYGLVQAEDEDGGMLRAYIPGLLEDNEILMKQDPGYINRVKAMPEPYRSAYLEGDWEIFIGQMFSFNQRDHVIKPKPVPSNAPLYMTFDWGFGKPFSIGWWWVDADNRLFRFAEWYGWNGQADQGLRLTDSQIKEGVIRREFKLGLRDPQTGMEKRHIFRLSGPDCFSKKPDYRGGGQGKSTAEVFSEPAMIDDVYCEGIVLSPGDPNRDLKVRQFHERLRVLPDVAPMMQIYDTCAHFIRTIPLLQQDALKPEDVDTKMEDHIYDEACHILMNRPLSLELPEVKPNFYQRRIDQLKHGHINTYEYIATAEQRHEINRLAGNDYSDPFGSVGDDFDEYDDGAMIDTI
jgi:hypothetical protein